MLNQAISITWTYWSAEVKGTKRPLAAIHEFMPILHLWWLSLTSSSMGWV